MEYLSIKYLHEVESEDSLYYINIDEIFGENENGHDVETIVEDHSTWGGESTPMEINTIIGILNSMREDGATHVEIMYHEDHGGYVFNAVEMRKATDEEIKAYREKLKQKTQSSKEREIAILEEKLKELKSE